MRGQRARRKSETRKQEAYDDPGSNGEQVDGIGALHVHDRTGALPAVRPDSGAAAAVVR
jgi:hypothetical protein